MIKELESLIRYARIQLEEEIKSSEDKTKGIMCSGLFNTWTQGIYKVGDIRLDLNGYPKECIVEHDSISNPEWTIDNVTLWKPWHSRNKNYALPWVTPTGSHDMYKIGEYMIWTDGTVKKCIEDTNFSPEEYAQAWESA